MRTSRKWWEKKWYWVACFLSGFLGFLLVLVICSFLFLGPLVRSLLLTLCGLALLLLFTFPVRGDDARGLSFWFIVKLAVGLGAGRSLAYLIQYYFAPSPVETGCVMLLGLSGLFAVILVARFRNFNKKGS